MAELEIGGSGIKRDGVDLVVEVCRDSYVGVRHLEGIPSLRVRIREFLDGLLSAGRPPDCYLNELIVDDSRRVELEFHRIRFDRRCCACCCRLARDRLTVELDRSGLSRDRSSLLYHRRHGVCVRDELCCDYYRGSGLEVCEGRHLEVVVALLILFEGYLYLLGRRCLLTGRLCLLCISDIRSVNCSCSLSRRAARRCFLEPVPGLRCDRECEHRTSGPAARVLYRSVHGGRYLDRVADDVFARSLDTGGERLQLDVDLCARLYL